MIWQRCEGSRHITSHSGTLYRLVESQEQVATRHYVDNLEEQALLEDLLEKVKPPLQTEAEPYHYLLKTPFRYPPLRWGSRFGRQHEPGIFYAGTSIDTTLAEAAFYRLVFFESMQAPLPGKSIVTQHTLFRARYRSDKGVTLHKPPFYDYREQLADPQHYAHSQQLGSDMRADGVQVFEYTSARSLEEGGLCVGLFTPLAFSHRQPDEKNAWLCEVSADRVQFKALGEREVTGFSRDDFLVEGRLPVPAA